MKIVSDNIIGGRVIVSWHEIDSDSNMAYGSQVVGHKMIKCMYQFNSGIGIGCLQKWNWNWKFWIRIGTEVSYKKIKSTN